MGPGQPGFEGADYYYSYDIATLGPFNVPSGTHRKPLEIDKSGPQGTKLTPQMPLPLAKTADYFWLIESRFSVRSNFAASAGVFTLPVNISRFVIARR